MGLIYVKIAFAEARIQLVHEVIGIEAVPVIGNEAYGRLAGAGKIENR
jgi:hypothetical protein